MKLASQSVKIFNKVIAFKKNSIYLARQKKAPYFNRRLKHIKKQKTALNGSRTCTISKSENLFILIAQLFTLLKITI